MDYPVFFQGVLIGFSIAAPVGPIGVLCIRRTLAEGRLTGFLSGAGAATADAVYGAVAAFGLAALSDLLLQQQIVLRLVGGLFLLYLGLRTLLSKPVVTAARASVNTASLAAAYLSTLLLTLTNPMTILSFLAIFAGFGAVGGNSGRNFTAITIVAGVFLGSLMWWFILSLLAGLFHKFLDGPRLIWVNRFSGMVILIFAITILISLLSSAKPATVVTPPPNGAALPPGQNSAQATAGFTRADQVRPLTFPADFGAHPEYQTEWWYYTGNLFTSDGRRFGYQLTFFRRALKPMSDQVQRSSAWAADQVYLAHFALTDVTGGEHYAYERLERGALNLAGVTAAPFEVWLDDWQVVEVAERLYQLQVSAPAAGIQSGEGNAVVNLELNLMDLKGPVLQGDQGYSRKGEDPGNASYYYSLTRLQTTGKLELNGQTFELHGNSWMDHEYSTSALSANQVGWDWFSIQLDNNQELMLFQLRKADGSIDTFSTAALIQADGSITRFSAQDFKIQALATWHSPRSGGEYPARWQIDIPAAGIALTLTPVLADQEMDLRYRYWEGAVDIQGTVGSQVVAGVGYVELTGYAQSMAGEF